MRIDRRHLSAGAFVLLLLLAAAIAVVLSIGDGASSEGPREVAPASEALAFKKRFDETPLLVSPRPADLVPADAPLAPPIRKPFLGVVRAADGAPAAHVRVILATLSPPSGALDRDAIPWFDGSPMFVVERTVTDALGRFSIAASAFDESASTTFLVADAPERFVPERVHDAPRGVEVHITLRAGGVVTGVVRAEETRGPVADVSVRVRSRVLGAAGFEEDEDVVRTDESGRYRIDHFVGEPTEFATRYALDAEWRAEAVTMPLIEQGEIVEKDLFVPISPYVAGVVVDAATGEPVAGASVDLSGPYARDARTDADGRFVLARVEPREGDVAAGLYTPGGARRLAVTSDRHLAASLLVRGSPASADLVIRLVRGVRVTGRVLDRAVAVAGARVEIGYLGRFLAAAKTSGDGRFAFDGIAPVRGASVRARAPNSGPGATLLDLDLTADVALDVALDDPGTAAIVFEASGFPSEAMGFTVRGLDHPGAEFEPGSERLLAGDYLATCRIRGERLETVVAVAKGETVRIASAESMATKHAGVAWVSGRAVHSTGDAVEDVRITVRNGGARSLMAEACPWLHAVAGAFELEVPSGEPIEFVVAAGDSGPEATVRIGALPPGGFASVGDVTCGGEGK